MAIKEDKYILYLDSYILLVQNSVLKQYNQSTNQIFINDSNIYLDSIITQFFSLNHLKTYNNQTRKNKMRKQIQRNDGKIDYIII